MTQIETDDPLLLPMVVLDVKINPNGIVQQKPCALLIVACDPRNLFEICDYTSDEVDLFTSLVNYTFHTSLLKVRRNQAVTVGKIFAPEKLDAMKGEIYGFRNETVKTMAFEGANKPDYSLITVYQLQGEYEEPWTPEQFQEALLKQIKALSWWHFGVEYGEDYDIVNTVTTPYFDHYSQVDLNKNLPWKLLDLQGKRRTLFVHAAASFESVLDVWEYGNLLFNSENRPRLGLPVNLSDPIIILGAGASGLLMALRLKRANYTNIEILEVTDRDQGKTHTIPKEVILPPVIKKVPVYCELGTCYMSSAYEDFRQYLGTQIIGSNRSVPLDANDPEYRAIITAGQFPSTYTAAPVMPYNDYIVLKAAADLGLPQIGPAAQLSAGSALCRIRYLSGVSFAFLASRCQRPV